MIAVDALTVQYGELRAVDQVSFSVFEQEIFGIVGPNGAGKTSTVECIEGLRRAHSGKVSVSGLDPWKDRKKLYEVMGVQLQDTAYQDQVRVGEICALFSSLYRSPVPYGELLEIMQLSGKEKAFVSSLSGGQRQKLAIVLALIPNPRIAFLDELTTGLDPRARHQMWDLLLQLRERGLTIVLVSHYMDEVEAVCDRVAIMDRGRMPAVGSVSEVIGRFALHTEISFRSSLERTGGLEALPGVVSVGRKRNRITVQGRGDETVLAVLEHLRDRGIDYAALAVKPPDLEAVFLNLVGYSPSGESPRADEKEVR
ncbi:MAG: ABC transporter ATP-binding protein [Firmicutes bacterium]|nr:ABC transporter ATP-binding protein [Bacillota bacterium]